jgi:hypothetical protein
MYTISAIAPTSYQYSSIRHFGLPIKQNPNGSYSIMQEYDEREEAKRVLRKAAHNYYDEYEGQVHDALESIEKFGTLTIDAVTATIDQY